MIEQQRVWFEAKISLLEARISGDCPATSMPLSTHLFAKPSKKGGGSGKNDVEVNEVDSEAFSFGGRKEFMKVKVYNIIVHGLT